jgi:hypothetical protein
MPDYEPLRYRPVPWGWLDEAMDLRRAGIPDHKTRCGASVYILGLVIDTESEMLAIKLVNGIPVSAALTSVVQVDTAETEPLSNPRRVTDYGED